MSHKYLILGLLAEQPMTGYDIRKKVSDILAVATTTSYGSLYPTLHQLLEKDLVSVEEVEQQARPAKKVYYITSQGQADLIRWLDKAPSEDKVKREFLLKLFFAANVSHMDSYTLISERRTKTEQLLSRLKTQRETTSNHRRLWLIDYEIAICRAELQWLDRIEQEISFA